MQFYVLLNVFYFLLCYNYISMSLAIYFLSQNVAVWRVLEILMPINEVLNGVRKQLTKHFGGNLKKDFTQWMGKEFEIGCFSFSYCCVLLLEPGKLVVSREHTFDEYIFLLKFK